jgi:hypothetical protein
LNRKALLREVNTRIREISDGFGAPDGSYRLLCECGDEDCAERLDVPIGQYDELRRTGGFLFAAGHEPAGTASPQATRMPAFAPADPVPLQ